MLDSKEINLQIINQCQLKCKFCARSWVSLEELTKIEHGIMKQSDFEHIVDHCVQNGKTRFCLTPRMGELFLDCNIIKKFEYLENHPDVEYYFFATNLLSASEKQLESITSFKKAYIEISMYGADANTYLSNTSRPAFPRFMSKLRLLFEVMLKQHQSFENFTFFIRWNQKWNNTFPKFELFQLLNKFELIKNCKISDNETHNFNFGGLIPFGSLEAEHPPKTKCGVCPTARTGCIMHNGDVGLCYMNDVFDNMIIGNIYENNLSDIMNCIKRKKILNDMSKDNYVGICEKCNEVW